MVSTPGGLDSLTRVTRAGVVQIQSIPGGFDLTLVLHCGGPTVVKDYLRWVWEHSFTEADFTDWADGFPTAEDNVADCAVMSQDQVGHKILCF